MKFIKTEEKKNINGNIEIMTLILIYTFTVSALSISCHSLFIS